MLILKWEAGTVNQSSVAFNSTKAGGWEKAWLQARDISGKHYFETILLSGSYLKSGVYTLNGSNYWHLEDYRGGCYANPGIRVSTPAYPLPARCMVAYDLDEGKIWFGANGTWWNSGDPVTGANPIYSNLLTVTGGVTPLYPGIECFSSSAARFITNPADWLYAPSGYTSPTAFDLESPRLAKPLRRDMAFGGHGRLTGDVVRARVAGDPAGAGDLFLARKKVFVMAVQEKKICAEQVSDANGVVTFDWLLEGHEFAAFTIAAKLPDDSYAIGDYWDRLFPSSMP